MNTARKLRLGPLLKTEIVKLILSWLVGLKTTLTATPRSRRRLIARRWIWGFGGGPKLKVTKNQAKLYNDRFRPEAVGRDKPLSESLEAVSREMHKALEGVTATPCTSWKPVLFTGSLEAIATFL